MRLAWVLAALVAARAALTFVPGMGLWGWNVQRFLSPLSAWLPWVVAALACVPAVARRLIPQVTRFGETLASRTTIALVTVGLGAAALVWMLPDRALWVGDSLVRLGGVRSELAPHTFSPQSLPLDVWIHYTLPQWLVAHGWFDAQGAVRWLGAMEAALLAVLAGFFALAIDSTPVGRATAFAVAFFGGYLCTMTGESKAFAEVVLAVAATAALGLRVRRDGRAILAMGAVTAVALAAHRSSLGLLPAFLIAWVTAWRGDAPRTARPIAIAALALPLGTLTAIGPRLWRTLVTYDLPANFFGGEAPGAGGLGALFSVARLLDLVSALLMLSPLALAIFFQGGRDTAEGARQGRAAPAAEGTRDRRGARAAESSPPPTSDSARASGTARFERAFLLTLAAPFLLAAFLARPPQGLFRDWDGLGAAGIALSLLAAWGLARTLKRPSQAWLAAPAIACAALFTLQWLLHYRDEPRATERIEAFLTEPPARPAAERARAWDFVGWRRFQKQSWDAAAVAFDSATSLSPTPRMLSQWAMAETMRENYAVARDLYRRAAAADPNFALAWRGVAIAAIWFEDIDDCERAVQQLERLTPDDPKIVEIRDYLTSARAGSAPTGSGSPPAPTTPAKPGSTPP